MESEPGILFMTMTLKLFLKKAFRYKSEKI